MNTNDKVKKLLTGTIYEWVKNNFGESEADDPSWDINALAEELTKQRHEIHTLVDDDFLMQDARSEAEEMGLTLNDAEARGVIEIYKDHEEIDHWLWQNIIKDVKERK